MQISAQPGWEEQVDSQSSVSALSQELLGHVGQKPSGPSSRGAGPALHKVAKGTGEQVHMCEPV